MMVWDAVFQTNITLSLLLLDLVWPESALGCIISTAGFTAVARCSIATDNT